MDQPVRRVCLALGCAGGVLAAITGVPSAQAPPASTPPVQEQRPVFRAGTHFVQVDIYPTRDGRIVEGLRPADFRVLEDGVPQTIEALEFIRVAPHTPDAERRDPDNQAEGNRLAADPRNRVFILYLDHYHNSLYGGWSLQRPIADLLNRMIAPNDLFGVATAHLRPRDLVFARRSVSLEAQLAEHWTWGLKTTRSIDFDPEEQTIERCYGEDVARLYAERQREERTLNAIDRLVEYLGIIREARKVMVVFTKGWPLYVPDLAWLNRFMDGSTPAIPRVGVSTGGQLTTTPAVAPGMADWSRCNTELHRVMNLDNRRKFFDLLERATRNNVVFYPVNPDGLTGGRDTLRTMADYTGGFALETNDVGAQLRRIADDVAAYYVAGYYSTNGTSDGSYRRIEVRVLERGVEVKARRGYYAPAPAPAPAPAMPATVGSAFEAALGALARLRPSAELFTWAAAGISEVAVAVELAAAASVGGATRGVALDVTLSDAAGGTTRIEGRIEPGARGGLVRVPASGTAGPYQVTVRAILGAEELTDRLAVAPRADALVGDPLLFRAMPSVRAPLWPVADLQFRRTERLRVEWAVLAAPDRREVRLLAKDGRPLPVPVTLTLRDVEGRLVLAADLALAPLGAGDYVIELTAGTGGTTDQRFVAFRVRP